MRNSSQPLNRRRSIRLQGYDYRDSGVYFVTICAYNKLLLFGNVVDGEVVHSPLGEIVCEEWRQLALARDNIELDRFVVMPNHLHGLLFIRDRREDEYGRRAMSPHARNPRRLIAGSLGAIVSQYKAGVSRRAWSSLIDRSQQIWQRNYYDHIVRNDSSLDQIRKYIIENPARWHDDTMYVE